MVVKYSNWYHLDSIQREASIKSVLNKLGFGVFAGLVMVMLGSTLWEAAQRAKVKPEEIQQALNNPTRIEQAQNFIQQEQSEEQEQEQPIDYPNTPTDTVLQDLIRLEGTVEYQTHTGSYRNNRFYPYNDTRNIPTIGYGHRILPGENFQNGITEQQAIQMLHQDAQIALDGANRLLNGYGVTPEAHEIVTEMTYQMGTTGVAGFEDMLEALQNHDYNTAADEMLDSEWARDQTPNRAIELANRMRNQQ